MHGGSFELHLLAIDDCGCALILDVCFAEHFFAILQLDHTGRDVSYKMGKRGMFD
jgi:hypothetical protein